MANFMAKIDFSPIKGSVGKYSDHGLIFTLKIPVNETYDLKKRLTVINNSLFFRMKQIMNTIDGLNAKIKQSNSKNYIKKLQYVIGNLFQEYKELQDNQKKEYFEQVSEDTFNLPPGLWYLADKIEGNGHLNKNVSVTWIDERLRPYQKEAVLELLKYKRATGVLATGLGKSLIISTICKNFELAGKRICVVVPTEELVVQMSQNIGVFCNTTAAGGKRKPRLEANVLVVTAASAIKYIDVYDVVIIDESHHSSASTWENLLLAAIKAEYVYNLTATPFRADGMDLGIHAFGGPTVFQKDTKWGVDNGWLAKPEIFFVNIIPKDKNQYPIEISQTKNPFYAYKVLTESPEVINFIIKNVNKAIEQNKKCLILYKTVKAGQYLAKILRENGIECGLASSNTKKVIKDFKENKIRVMISNDKLVGEGVDIPDADILFNIIQNSSNTTTFQVAGRVLRLSEGKIKATIIDVCIHGYNQFVNSGKKRMAIYQKICDNVQVINKRY
jgi:superfamily II DNA or RNA helicase